MVDTHKDEERCPNCGCWTDKEELEACDGVCYECYQEITGKK